MEGRRNEVLNRMEIGTMAFYYGDLQDAADNLDVALDAIESVWANSGKAVAARSLWHNEGEKDFKGEPYERLMAFYYRGLVHLANDDYENAAVLFKGGLAQDGFAEEAQNRANFALLMFLEGWADQCRGNYRDAIYNIALNSKAPAGMTAERLVDLVFNGESKDPNKWLAGARIHHRDEPWSVAHGHADVALILYHLGRYTKEIFPETFDVVPDRILRSEIG